MATTSSLSLTTTFAPDAAETTAYTTTDQALDSSTSEAPSGQEASDSAARHDTDTVPGVRIETDILLLIPESVMEGGPAAPADVPQSGKPLYRGRSIQEPDDYDIQVEDPVYDDDDDMEVAETLVFKPFFRHRKNSGSRRRVYRNEGPKMNDGPKRNDGPYRKVFRYCPPCRYYYY
jgi:hypothetical protein